ncbi:hypothetical protein K504DRAFT_28600 [Pleomassaria siparia CBS 279.74]|uniref:Uncharacterized protein n=1 Tax=Pleomassaria siparia CBS 279.74 TaxID=1314801 RepID=A0A6G1KSR9_9PLEO|nr:hypothetical protein K504DRAFT_28600 [Pleomassaria siparia CBS 279.74]
MHRWRGWGLDFLVLVWSMYRRWKYYLLSTCFMNLYPRYFTYSMYFIPSRLHYPYTTTKSYYIHQPSPCISPSPSQHAKKDNPGAALSVHTPRTLSDEPATSIFTTEITSPSSSPPTPPPPYSKPLPTRTASTRIQLPARLYTGVPPARSKPDVQQPPSSEK